MRAKKVATNPPQHARLRPAGPLPNGAGDAATIGVPSDKETKKREARARKRQARQQAKAASRPAPAPQDQHADSQAADQEVIQQAPAPSTVLCKLALPVELVRAIPLLLPNAAKQIVDNLALDSVPAGSQEQRSPEAVVAKLLGDRGPSAKVARKAELEAQISRLKAILVTMGTDDSVNEATKMVQEKLDGAVASLNKLAKATPSQDHERMAMAEAKSSYELAVQARRDRELRGAAKAEARRIQRQKLLDDLKEQVGFLEEGLKTTVAENNQKHAARAAAAADFDGKVLALLDRKLDELKANGPGQEAGAQVAATAPPQAPTPLEELKAAKEQIAQLQQRLQAAADRVQTAFDKAFDVEPSQLPKASLPAQGHLPSYGALYRTIQSWTMAGATNPFDWDALAAVTGQGGPHPTDIATNLLGPIWQKWYTAAPDGSEVVPRQLALLLFHGLNGIKFEYESQEQEQLAASMAVDAYGAVRASAKRLRPTPGATMAIPSAGAAAIAAVSPSSSSSSDGGSSSEAAEAARKAARTAMRSAEGDLVAAQGVRHEG